MIDAAEQRIRTFLAPPVIRRILTRRDFWSSASIASFAAILILWVFLTSFRDPSTYAVAVFVTFPILVMNKDTRTLRTLASFPAPRRSIQRAMWLCGIWTPLTITVPLILIAGALKAHWFGQVSAFTDAVVLAGAFMVLQASYVEAFVVFQQRRARSVQLTPSVTTVTAAIHVAVLATTFLVVSPYFDTANLQAMRLPAVLLIASTVMISSWYRLYIKWPQNTKSYTASTRSQTIMSLTPGLLIRGRGFRSVYYSTAATTVISTLFLLVFILVFITIPLRGLPKIGTPAMMGVTNSTWAGMVSAFLSICPVVVGVYAMPPLRVLRTLPLSEYGLLKKTLACAAISHSVTYAIVLLVSASVGVTPFLTTAATFIFCFGICLILASHRFEVGDEKAVGPLAIVLYISCGLVVVLPIWLVAILGIAASVYGTHLLRKELAKRNYHRLQLAEADVRPNRSRLNEV